MAVYAGELLRFKTYVSRMNWSEFWIAGSANLTWFNSYHTYADHLQFLKDIVASYPANSEIVTAGNSVAGRPITGIHFYGSGGKGSKPAIVIHGTVHAREWISTMVCLIRHFEIHFSYWCIRE
jgi:hypothetical protein